MVGSHVQQHYNVLPALKLKIVNKMRCLNDVINVFLFLFKYIINPIVSIQTGDISLRYYCYSVTDASEWLEGFEDTLIYNPDRWCTCVCEQVDMTVVWKNMCFFSDESAF